LKKWHERNQAGLSWAVKALRNFSKREVEHSSRILPEKTRNFVAEMKAQILPLEID